MRKGLVITFALVCAFAIAMVAGRANAASAAKADTSITGTGSSFVFPLVARLEVDPRDR